MSLSSKITELKELVRRAECYDDDREYFELTAHKHIPLLISAYEIQREALALMAEGEGPDVEVYMQMSNAALEKVEKLGEG